MLSRVWATAHAMHHPKSMRRRTALLCLLAATLSCEDNKMSGATGGAGGSTSGGTGSGSACATNLAGRVGTITSGSGTGASGTAGSNGTSSGGQGGSGSMLPACTNAGGYGAGTLANVDGTSILAPLTATVTMTAVDDNGPGNGSAIRVTLADVASTRKWVWWLSIPDLPADQINGCDRYELTVDAASCPFPGGSCQSVVLARNGVLVAFSVDLQAGLIPIPNALAPWGITVADAGAVCAIPSPTCGENRHAARVTVGTETATLAPYQTATLQGLSISVGSFTAYSHTMCDVPATTRMVGFRLP